MGQVRDMGIPAQVVKKILHKRRISKISKNFQKFPKISYFQKFPKFPKNAGSLYIYVVTHR
jgi:hypothetical protein